MVRNLLFVSIAFPPKADAEGLQVAKYLKYLLRLGEGSFAIDAVTSAPPTLNMPYDASLEPMKRGVRQIVELPIYENRYTNFLIRKVLPWTATMPDQKFTFHLQASRVIRQLRVRPDLIYSRSFPLSSAVLAWRLKRHYGVPWVMHMSDVWADCPERHYVGLSRKIQEKLERKCFEAADVICVTSEKTRAFYRSKYPSLAHRIEHYPNVFDREDAPTSEIEGRSGERPSGGNASRFRIVHTGSLVGSRSPAPLLEALSRLEPGIQRGLEVLLVGPVDLANSKVVQHWNLPFVKLLGQVEYRESLRLQRSADLLVLIDMPVANPDLRVYFPSKLLDYMLAGPPIVAIGDEGSEIQRVLQEQALGQYAERHDAGAIARCLQAFIEAPGSGEPVRVHSAPEIYSAEYHAARLLALFEDCLTIPQKPRSREGRLETVGRSGVALTRAQPQGHATVKARLASRRVAIISYGTGNLASLSDALEAAGAACNVVSTAGDLADVDALVLPGVGHFGHAMNFFRASGLLAPVLEMIRSGVPTLGICLGFQLLTRSSEEGEGEPGLAMLPLSTLRIRPSAPHLHKVPHLGWNGIHREYGASRLLKGIPSDRRLFYYANAYAAKWAEGLPPPIATFSHGDEYVALIEQGSVFGVQFHPEKSREQGLQLLRNFLEA